MIIGVDTRIPVKNKTGIGYMIHGLIPELVRISGEHSFKLLGEGLGIRARKGVFTLRFPKIIQRGFNFLWKNIGFPPANIILGKTDVFLFTNFVDFPVKARKKILLLCDISYIRHPEFIEKKNLDFLLNNVGPSIRRADHVLTISENAKRELMQYYNLPEDKIEIIYPALPKREAKTPGECTIKETLGKFKIKKDFILFVGTLEPRKNILGLLEAYSILPEKMRESFGLVVAGGKGWNYDAIYNIIKKKGLGDSVVFTGYVSDKELVSLYSEASLFVLPSFYEGFGIPVLEAMFYGAPVACSKTSSLPEVGGDAAAYFDPKEPSEIADVIQGLLEDKKMRDDLVAKGRERAKLFSWENGAEKVLKIINSK